MFPVPADIDKYCLYRAMRPVTRNSSHHSTRQLRRHGTVLDLTLQPGPVSWGLRLEAKCWTDYTWRSAKNRRAVFSIARSFSCGEAKGIHHLSSHSLRPARSKCAGGIIDVSSAGLPHIASSDSHPIQLAYASLQGIRLSFAKRTHQRRASANLPSYCVERGIGCVFLGRTGPIPEVLAGGFTEEYAPCHPTVSIPIPLTLLLFKYSQIVKVFGESRYRHGLTSENSYSNLCKLFIHVIYAVFNLQRPFTRRKHSVVESDGCIVLCI